MNYARPLNLSPCTTGGLSIPLQDAQGESLVMSPVRAALRYCTLRYPLSPLRGQGANNQE